MPSVRLRFALLGAAAMSAATLFVVACSSSNDDGGYLPPGNPPKPDAAVEPPLAVADCRVERDEALPCDKLSWSDAPPWVATDVDGGPLDGAAPEAGVRADGGACHPVRHVAIGCEDDGGTGEVHHGITIAAGRDGKGWALGQDRRGRRRFEYTPGGSDEGRGFRDEGAPAALSSDGETPAVVTSIAYPRRGVVYSAAEGEAAPFDADPDVDDLAVGAWHADDGTLLAQFRDNSRTNGNRVFVRSPRGDLRLEQFELGRLVVGPSAAYLVATPSSSFEGDKFDWGPLGQPLRTIHVPGGHAGSHFTVLPGGADLPPAFLRQLVYGSKNAWTFFVYLPRDATRYAMVRIAGEPPPSGPCAFDVATGCAGSCTEEVSAIEEDSMRLTRGDDHLYLGYLVERRLYETTATVDEPSQLECALLGLCKKYCAASRSIREKRGEHFALAEIDLATLTVRELLRVDAGIDGVTRNDGSAMQLFVRDGFAHVGLRTSAPGTRSRLSVLVVPFAKR